MITAVEVDVACLPSASPASSRLAHLVLLAAGSGSFLLDAWMAQLGQAVFPRGRSWSVRIMCLAFGYGSASALADWLKLDISAS